MRMQNEEALQTLCTASVAELRKLGDFQRTDSDGAGFTMLRRDARVLGIAHTDVNSKVQNYGKDLQITATRVKHPWLDDRLGLHALLHCLPDLGVTFDVMLTEKEEISKSTGGSPQAIAVASKYNWMFMMDRAGDDCAMYEYDADGGEWSDALDRHGWRRMVGTASCIKSMKAAGVKGANFGVGYHEEHSDLCYVEIPLYIQQCKRVAEFVQDFGAQRFAHSEENGTAHEE